MELSLLWSGGFGGLPRVEGPSAGAVTTLLVECPAATDVNCGLSTGGMLVTHLEPRARSPRAYSEFPS